MSETPSTTDDALDVTRSIRIPRSEFDFTYVRSSGPGGQNVNKVASKAQLRWPVAESPSLPDDVRQRFLKRYARRVTNEGELVMTSQRYRDRDRNAADCLEKLREMIREVAVRPKRRKPTKPTRGSVDRRIKAKKQRGEKKRRRRSPRWDD